MDFTERTIESEMIYDGRILKFKIDKVELPNGEIGERELVEHPGGVAVVAVDDEGNILMVEQYRKPYERNLLEIPAGKLDKNEDIEDCGRRELEEETGYIAEKFEYLGECYPSVGYTNEIIRIFLATGLSKTSQNLDDDEFLNVYKLPVREVLDKIMNNELADAKTVMGVMKAVVKLGIVK
ncbi:MAG: NUDIX hydrolase [Eubacteriales bacterium]|nr:NUDIX hydrolase [Eubacteriales bacterium]